MGDEMIEVFNVNKPGLVSKVRRDKYEEVKRVLRELMPEGPPGLTQEELAELCVRNVSPSVFEDPGKAGWWMKTVQLDLEVRQVLVREKTKPARWHYEKSRPELAPEVLAERRPQKKAVNEPSPEIRDALASQGLQEAFDRRPYYQRNDYVGWIQSAKRPETREKRLAQMLEELRDGRRYMNMDYGAD